MPNPLLPPHQPLIDALDAGVLLVNPQGRISLANRAARGSLNLSVGMHLGEALPELKPRLAEVLKTGRAQRNIEILLSGIGFFVNLVPVIEEKKLTGVLCRFTEGTDLEEATRKIRSFEDLTRELDAIIDSSSDGLWVCDGEANVIRINPASERINGVTAAEVQGRNSRDLDREGRIFQPSAVLEALKERKQVSLLQQKKGKKLISTGTPVFDEQGELIRVVVSEHDITELDSLQRDLEEQEAMRDRFRDQILEMQQTQVASRNVIARSPEMVRALKQAQKVAGVDSTVLILGESGVGKGLIADLIHQSSNRREKPIIKLNCGAIPESLIESELFGYDKGAFTGATTSKPGQFELADGGILFLDEIAELPLAAQVKLLRFLEDGCITRLGGTKPRTLDVRVLAATHRDLEELVAQERFRLDLYYRLNVIPINVPAVRERRDCIVPLLRHYMDEFGKKNQIVKRLSWAATDALLAYGYPGNVRELMNICERLVVMSETEIIDLKDLPATVTASTGQIDFARLDWPEGMNLPQVQQSVERGLLMRAKQQFGNQVKMAEALGVNQSTIARKMKRYGLD